MFSPLGWKFHRLGGTLAVGFEMPFIHLDSWELYNDRRTSGGRLRCAELIREVNHAPFPPWSWSILDAHETPSRYSRQVQQTKLGGRYFTENVSLTHQQAYGP